MGLKITASIGISMYPHDGNNVESLLWCADKCMYVVKARGGNNFHISEELTEA